MSYFGYINVETNSTLFNSSINSVFKKYSLIPLLKLFLQKNGSLKICKKIYGN